MCRTIPLGTPSNPHRHSGASRNPSLYPEILSATENQTPWPVFQEQVNLQTSRPHNDIGYGCRVKPGMTALAKAFDMQKRRQEPHNLSGGRSKSDLFFI
jgi:hypothetical protein